MSNLLIFIQVHDRPEILETEIPAAATLGELHAALAVLGITVDAETFIFVDEAEEHEHNERNEPLRHVKHGSRVHVGRCKRIATTANFLDKSEERAFPPGARVRAQAAADRAARARLRARARLSHARARAVPRARPGDRA